ncbi:MAG TPA: HEPN domain-containing protein [Solirubrobacteraceae bacterium]
MTGDGELARQLLERADDDVAAARALLAVPDVSDFIIGFHAQQAVEKALKAVRDHAGGRPGS